VGHGPRSVHIINTFQIMLNAGMGASVKDYCSKSDLIVQARVQIDLWRELGRAQISTLRGSYSEVK